MDRDVVGGVSCVSAVGMRPPKSVLRKTDSVLGLCPLDVLMSFPFFFIREALIKL